MCVCTGCVCVCVLLTGLLKSTQAQLDPRAMRPQSMQQTLLQIAPANALAFPSLSRTRVRDILELYCLHISGLPKLGACCVLSTSRPPLRRLSALSPHALFYVFLCMPVCVCQYVCLCFFIACCQAQQHIGLPLKNIRSHFSDSFHKIVQNVFLYFYFFFFLGQLPFYICNVLLPSFGVFGAWHIYLVAYFFQYSTAQAPKMRLYGNCS